MWSKEIIAENTSLVNDSAILAHRIVNSVINCSAPTKIYISSGQALLSAFGVPPSHRA